MSTTSANDSSPQPDLPLLPPFSKSARYYDALYQGKDYAAEAKLYDQFLSPARHLWHFGTKDSLIEFGCGTGKFSRELAALDWQVTGVDASADMIKIANANWQAARVGDIASDRLFANHYRTHLRSVFQFERWNAVCAPFAVMSYACLNNWKLTQAMQNARRALRTGGRFVFDVTHAASAIASLRPLEEREADLGGGARIRRVMHKQFDLSTSIVQYDMEFEVTSADGSIDAWREQHLLRAFAPQELRFLLEQFGFQSVFICNMAGTPQITTDDWHILVVAEGVERS